jgi:hypothetical protein
MPRASTECDRVEHIPLQLDRRAFLGVLGGALVAACGGQAPQPPSLSDYESSIEREQGYIAAAAVLIALTEGPQKTVESTAWAGGHAGLVTINSQLVLVTAKHILQPTGAKGTTIEGLFPGITGQQDWRVLAQASQWTKRSQFEVHVDRNPNNTATNNLDTIAGYQLSLPPGDQLTLAVKDGRIRPLTVAPIQILKDSVPKYDPTARPTPRVPIPLGIVGAGGQILRGTYSHTEFDGASAIDFSGFACEGQSGQPILELDVRGNPTGRSFGLLSGGHGTDQCGQANVLFIPFM